ncbi:MAG: helix-turn-helix transcriptional regulator [Desulfobacterales bacterium]|nr:MAG: helix-turn-helix transcriptional regulator [Desulfobacterales bacterium]
MSAFGEKVTDLRRERGLAAKEVCQKAGIPQSRLIELERGIRIPTPGQIDKLEKFFGVNSGGLAELAKLEAPTQ